MYCCHVTSEVYTETVGSGPSLVLLHANGGDHRDFAAVAPRLAESGWRVTSLDWPGHGRSPRSGSARAADASRSGDRVEVFANIWRSFTDPEHDARPLAGAVQCPTLLCWGTSDPILPWRIDGRRARAALPEAEIVTFDGAGHQPFIERPEEFLDRTSSFMSRLRVANSA